LNDLDFEQPENIVVPIPANAIAPVVAADFLINSLRFKL
tara:strand:- start:542 stop:658 length:117 start_codon:yes stop_codon:yes gene_type:complete